MRVSGRNFWFILLGSLFFFLTRNVVAQEVVARVTVDSTSALIGQPVRMVLQLSQPKSLSVNWPLIIDSLGAIEIWKYEQVDTLDVDDESVLLRSQVLYLTSYDSGVFTIPSIDFKYTSGKGVGELVASTDPLQITFNVVPVDTTQDIRDIRNVEAAPFDYSIILYGLIAFHVILLIVALLVWAFRKKSSVEKPVEEFKILVSPHIEALEALVNLEEERVWQEGRVKEYYTRLTDIMRVYIERRWGFRTLELTSDEILSHAAISGINNISKQELDRILRLSDLVKFARWQAIPSENEWAMQLAQKFVRDTAVENHPDASGIEIKEVQE